MNKKMTFRDVEQVSAYLDGQLSRVDAARLESRLEQDPNLRAVMEDLRRTRAVLRAAPRRRAPHNFMLKAEKQRVRPPVPRAVPVLRLASLATTLLLVVTVATNFVVPMAASRAPAPMAYGMGGGGGGGADDQAMESAAVEEPAAAPEMMQSAPAATEEPMMAMPAATEEPAPEEPAVVDAVPTQGTEEPLQSNKLPTEEDLAGGRVTPIPQPEPKPELPVPAFWQIGLLIAALILGMLAFGLRWLNDRRWQRKQ